MKQNALMMYLRMLGYTLLALLVRAISLLPLVCLFVLEGAARWVAALCPLLLILVVLPLRYSFAQAMADAKTQRRFSVARAFTLEHYGEKLTESLLHALHVIKWGILLFAMLGYGYYCYSQVDALTLYESVANLGKWWQNTACAIVNVFGANAVPAANAFMDGVMALALILLAGMAVWGYGAVRNSASRYLWAQATLEDREPRVEIRRRLRGRRWLQLLVSLGTLVLWIPFAVCVASAAKTAVSDLSTMLMMAITTGYLPTDELVKLIVPTVLSFVLLYLPLVPVRRWITCSFALAGRKMRKEAQA